jgi:hypothetical protein
MTVFPDEPFLNSLPTLDPSENEVSMTTDVEDNTVFSNEDEEPKQIPSKKDMFLFDKENNFTKKDLKPKQVDFEDFEETSDKSTDDSLSN